MQEERKTKADTDEPCAILYSFIERAIWSINEPGIKHRYISLKSNMTYSAASPGYVNDCILMELNYCAT